jgi:hypothetical protein
VGPLTRHRNWILRDLNFAAKLREVFGDEGSRTRGENFFWKPIVHWRSSCHPEVLITNITKLLGDILGHIGIAPYRFSCSALKISFASEAQEAEENFGCVCRVTTPDLSQ